MGNARNFYEEYWQEREGKGRLHIKEGARVPLRIQIATSMIYKKDKRLTCIDIGCGEGTLGKLLREKFGNNLYIIGCDISTTALKYAESCYDEIFQIDIESEKFLKKVTENKFDYVICLEMLEHLFKPEEALRRFKKILKDNGEIIVSFPNIAWYKYRMDMLRGEFPRNYLLFPGEHIQNFTVRSFDRLLKNEKFIPVHTEGQFIFPKFFKLTKIFIPILKRFSNLFNYQCIVKARAKKDL